MYAKQLIFQSDTIVDFMVHAISFTYFFLFSPTWHMYGQRHVFAIYVCLNRIIWGYDLPENVHDLFFRLVTSTSINIWQLTFQNHWRNNLKIKALIKNKKNL